MSRLKSAIALAQDNPTRWPGESVAYRQARNALLVREIELRRQIEAVAEERRRLPPGGEVTRTYRFIGDAGPTDFAGLFGRHDTLAVYTYMFGPQRERPCPMCSSLLAAWDGEVPDITQRIALAVTARSPIDRLLAFKRERGWQHLPLFEDADGAFSRDYGAFSRDYGAIAEDGSDIPNLHVFTRTDGTVRHFWSGEMGDWTADPGQDPRGAPDLMPIWTILDSTPEGRDPHWYPSLSY